MVKEIVSCLSIQKTRAKLFVFLAFLTPHVPSLDFSTSESDPSDSEIDLDDPESDLPGLQSDPGDPESIQENIENTQEESNSFLKLGL